MEIFRNKRTIFGGTPLLVGTESTKFPFLLLANRFALTPTSRVITIYQWDCNFFNRMEKASPLDAKNFRTFERKILGKWKASLVLENLKAGADLASHADILLARHVMRDEPKECLRRRLGRTRRGCNPRCEKLELPKMRSICLISQSTFSKFSCMAQPHTPCEFTRTDTPPPLFFFFTKSRSVPAKSLFI